MLSGVGTWLFPAEYTGRLPTWGGILKRSQLRKSKTMNIRDEHEGLISISDAARLLGLTASTFFEVLLVLRYLPTDLGTHSTDN